MTDEQLIAAAKAGDEAAYRQILERYVPLITGYFTGKAGHPATEDLVQDVFISAFNSMHTVNSRALGPWLLGIARHKLHDFYRSQAADRALISAMAEQHAGAGLHSVDTAPGPAAHAESRQLEALTLQALGEMKETYRVVLYLRLFEELSYVDIAQRLGLKDVTVRLRARRGLALLRKKLDRHGLTPTAGGRAYPPRGRAYPPGGRAYPRAGSESHTGSPEKDPHHET